MLENREQQDPWGEASFDEVVEGEERIENRSIWKVRRSKGSSSPMEKCSIFHNSVCDKMQKEYFMLL